MLYSDSRKSAEKNKHRTSYDVPFSLICLEYFDKRFFHLQDTTFCLYLAISAYVCTHHQPLDFITNQDYNMLCISPI